MVRASSKKRIIELLALQDEAASIEFRHGMSLWDSTGNVQEAVEAFRHAAFIAIEALRTVKAALEQRSSLNTSPTNSALTPVSSMTCVPAHPPSRNTSPQEVRPLTRSPEHDGALPHPLSESVAPIVHTADVTVDEAGFEAVNTYTLLSELGSGAHGKVMLALDSASHEQRAIKLVARRAFVGDEPTGEDVMREVAIMKKLSHPHIVKLYECIDDPHDDTVYLVTQYVEGGPLLHFDANLRCTPMPLDNVVAIMKQLASVLVYMHHRGVVHRDIKPDNILVDKSGNIFLTDFGISAIIKKQLQHHSRAAHEDVHSAHPFTPSREMGAATVASSPTQAYRGTPFFSAPEVVDSDGTCIGAPADMWSVGVTLYAMLYGTLPFRATNFVELVDEILHKTVEFPNSTSGSDMQSLIQSLLQKDASQRLTAKQLARHPALVRSPPISPNARQEEEPLHITPTREEIAGAFTTHALGSAQHSLAALDDSITLCANQLPRGRFARITRAHRLPPLSVQPLKALSMLL